MIVFRVNKTKENYYIWGLGKIFNRHQEEETQMDSGLLESYSG